MLTARSDVRVAAILVDFNEGPLLDKTLRLLREQTRRPDRIIVVDNDSSDGSPDEIERSFPEVEVLRLGRNAGLAVANNTGARAAEDCDWLLLLNPDAFPEPGCVEALLAATREEPAYDVLACRMMRATAPEELDGVGDAYHVSGLAWRRDHGRPLTTSPDALRRHEVFAACGAAVMYRREVFAAAGGFDERFVGYLEDTDLAFRLQLRGHRCLYVPDAVVHHVGSATTGAASEYTVYHTQRNMVWTWVKNMPWPLVALYLPHHLAANSAMAAWYGARGRAGATWRGKRDAVRGLRPVLRQRRELQGHRLADPWEMRRRMERGLTPLRGTSTPRRVVGRLRGRPGTRAAVS